MKKIFRAIILLMPFILFSCFEFVSGANTSKRMLNLALAAPGDVAKLHIGVFDGAITPETMIYNQTVAAGSSIPMDLPVGINRIVLVWAEGFDGLANYFGSIGPIAIEENGDTPLPIQMKRFDNNTASFNISRNRAGQFFWNLIPGSLNYELYFHDTSFGDYIFIIVENTYMPDSKIKTIDTYRIRVSTSVFGLASKGVQLP